MGLVIPKPDMLAKGMPRGNLGNPAAISPDPANAPGRPAIPAPNWYSDPSMDEWTAEALRGLRPRPEGLSNLAFILCGNDP